MVNNRDNNAFRRGILSLVVLSLLKREDMYGYQLVQEIERVSEGRIITQEGSLYPVLYKLLDEGYISDLKIQVDKRMTRIFYHLEPKGDTYLKKLSDDYQQITKGVHLILKEADYEQAD